MKKFTLTVMSAILGMLSMSAVDADQLYVVGSATAAGWSPDKALEMTKVSDNVFSWTGELKGGEFKFLTTFNEWHPSITCDFNTEGQQNQIVASGQTYDLFLRPGENDGQDNKFQIEVSGTYTLNVNLNDMKMAVTLDSEGPMELYIIGDATNVGWSTDLNQLANDRQKLTLGENGHYTWSGDLKEGRFRFINTASWWPSYTTANEEGDTEAGVGTFDLRFWDSTQGPDPEAAFAVNAENAGSYTIDIDVDNLQMTMTKNAETLFMMGNALTGAAGVWSLEWAQAFTPTATEHEFEWNGFLYAEDEEGLPTQFKFIKTADDWAGYVATQENQEIAVGQSYDIAPSNGNPDWKFTVPTEGYYKLTVNTEALSIKVAQGQDGIAAAETAGSIVKVNGLNLTVEGANADVFDAMGRTSAANASAATLPAAGIYVVVVNGKALKVAAK